MSKEKQDIVTKVAEKIGELDQLEVIEEMLQRGVYEFSLSDKQYRVKKPSHQERMAIQKKRRDTYAKMVQDDSYMFEDQWKKVYKEKGIDLDNMDGELVFLQKEHDNALLRLSKTDKVPDVKTLEKQIIDIRTKQAELMERKSELLQYSIENSLNEEINSYSLYLLLELKDGDVWKRVYKTYEDFLASNNENLILKGAYYLTLLLWRKDV